VRRLEGEVLAENTAALTLMRGAGFSVRRDPESPELCLVERELGGGTRPPPTASTGAPAGS
jgi:hypothetical protein